MKMQELVNIISELEFDKMTQIYDNGNQSLHILRPSKLSARFKDYDVNKNFQIFLKIGNEEAFRPNHLRLLLDLKLRSRELPHTKEAMLLAFDNIFYGKDPLKAIECLNTIPFTQQINPLDITSVLAQLFIAEQNIGFGGESKYNRRKCRNESFQHSVISLVCSLM